MEYNNAINTYDVKRCGEGAPLYTAGYGERFATIIIEETKSDKSDAFPNV